MKSVAHYLVFLIHFFCSLLLSAGMNIIAVAVNKEQIYMGYVLAFIGFAWLMIQSVREADRFSLSREKKHD